MWGLAGRVDAEEEEKTGKIPPRSLRDQKMDYFETRVPYKGSDVSVV